MSPNYPQQEVNKVLWVKGQHIQELERKLESVNEKLMKEKQYMLSVQKVSIALMVLYIHHVHVITHSY